MGGHKSAQLAPLQRHSPRGVTGSRLKLAGVRRYTLKDVGSGEGGGRLDSVAGWPDEDVDLCSQGQTSRIHWHRSALPPLSTPAN